MPSRYRDKTWQFMLLCLLISTSGNKSYRDQWSWYCSKCHRDVSIIKKPFNAVSHLTCFDLIEPRHDKTNKVSVRPAKTQLSLGIRPVWSESSLSAWRKLGPLATNWVHSEDSGQTGRMPRLIWVFAGRTLTLLVLSCCSSSRLTRLWINYYLQFYVPKSR